jgi:hypothetical protein
MSLFASDYSPVVSPGSVSPASSDPLAQKGKSLVLGPDGEKHEEPVSNIDKLTGLPTPPRSPPVEASSNMTRNGSDGSGSGSGSGSNSGSRSGGRSVKASGTTSAGASTKSSATLLDLDQDPLDKPYVATRKGNGYNTYEGCMEGES